MCLRLTNPCYLWLCDLIYLWTTSSDNFCIRYLFDIRTSLLQLSHPIWLVSIWIQKGGEGFHQDLLRQMTSTASVYIYCITWSHFLWQNIYFVTSTFKKKKLFYIILNYDCPFKSNFKLKFKLKLWKSKLKLLKLKLSKLKLRWKLKSNFGF